VQAVGSLDGLGRALVRERAVLVALELVIDGELA
jgi:hypothetical protein